MTKSEVLKLCWFFDGESMSRCPYERGSDNAKLWQAEMFCYDYNDVVTDHEKMKELIYSYLGKWDPYHAEELMRYYVEIIESHPKGG